MNEGKLGHIATYLLLLQLPQVTRPEPVCRLRQVGSPAAAAVLPSLPAPGLPTALWVQRLTTRISEFTLK